MLRIRVQAEDFDPGAELALLQADDFGGIGGVASFIGTVRDNAQHPLAALHLEHYAAMTQPALSKIAEQAAQRWQLINCTIIHRFGRLKPGENIVFTGASSPHRQAALAATEFLIDQLKTNAPFWKREEFRAGSSEWVSPRAGDL